MKSSPSFTLAGRYQVVSKLVNVYFLLIGIGTVYKIPPLKVNEGHRANDWGDLAQPLWKGRLRIIEKSSGTALHFEDGTTGMSISESVFSRR
jgi:hypothetical protein